MGTKSEARQPSRRPANRGFRATYIWLAKLGRSRGKGSACGLSRQERRSGHSQREACTEGTSDDGVGGKGSSSRKEVAVDDVVEERQKDKDETGAEEDCGEDGREDVS